MHTRVSFPASQFLRHRNRIKSKTVVCIVISFSIIELFAVDAKPTYLLGNFDYKAKSTVRFTSDNPNEIAVPNLLYDFVPGNGNPRTMRQRSNDSRNVSAEDVINLQSSIDDAERRGRAGKKDQSK